MMSDVTETETLAARMRADGWADVTVRITAYDDKARPGYQVDATNPFTRERVYIANLNVYHAYYGAPAAVAV